MITAYDRRNVHILDPSHPPTPSEAPQAYLDEAPPIRPYRPTPTSLTLPSLTPQALSRLLSLYPTIISTPLPPGSPLHILSLDLQAHISRLPPVYQSILSESYSPPPLSQSSIASAHHMTTRRLSHLLNHVIPSLILRSMWSGDDHVIHG